MVYNYCRLPSQNVLSPLQVLSAWHIRRWDPRNRKPSSQRISTWFGKEVSSPAEEPFTGGRSLPQSTALWEKITIKYLVKVSFQLIKSRTNQNREVTRTRLVHFVVLHLLWLAKEMVWKQLMLKNKLMRSIHHFQRKSQDSQWKKQGKFHSVSNTIHDTLTFTNWHYTTPFFISHTFPWIRTDQIESCVTLESYGVRKSRIFAFRGAVRGWM